MINRTPWLWGARKTAANMTGRTSNGIHILQGKRAPGQSNPSLAYTQAQQIAAYLWPLFRQNQGMVRANWTSVAEGKYAANEWYEDAFAAVVAAGTVPLTSAADIATIVMAKGQITETSVDNPAIADLSVGTVAIDMVTTIADATQVEGDILKINIFNIDRGTYTYGQATGGRSTWGAISLDLPAETQVGDDIVIWTSATGGPLGLYPGGSSESVTMIATVVA